MLGETATVFKLPLCLLIPQHFSGTESHNRCSAGGEPHHGPVRSGNSSEVTLQLGSRAGSQEVFQGTRTPRLPYGPMLLLLPEQQVFVCLFFLFFILTQQQQPKVQPEIKK